VLSVFLMLKVDAPAQSALDGFDPNVDRNIAAIVIQPDGKILIGGDFTSLAPNGGPTISRNGLARLNVDGTVDTVFNPNSNSGITSIALQSDGKIIVGGAFTTIGGQARKYLARLDPITGLADSFDPNPNEIIRALLVQSDGKVLAAGDFATIGGQSRKILARIDPATGLADSFNPNPDGNVFALTLQRDGRILVGGIFTKIGGQNRNRIARLDKAGLADSFNPNINANVNPQVYSEVGTITVQSDGKILVAGDFSDVGGQQRAGLARLDGATGAADSFNPNPNSAVSDIVLHGDGKILVVGHFTSIGGQARNGIGRLDPVTALADSFDPHPNADLGVGVAAIGVQCDGKIVVAGHFTSFSPNGGPAVMRHNIARLETDGRLDQTLDLGIDGPVVATAVQPDGKILIGGAFTTVLGVARNNIARLNTDGTLDLSFDPNANSDVYSIVVQADGKALVAGVFDIISGELRPRIARIDLATGLIDSFNPNANNTITAVAVQADGKILVAGFFTSVGGQTRNRIARLDAITGSADSFDPNANGSVRSIAVQVDGKILACGLFTTLAPNGGTTVTRNRLARLETNGTLDTTFDPNANSSVLAIAVQPDGKILVGGAFNGANSIGGQTRNRLARLDAISGSADSFDPNANGSVHSIALQADGKILVGGVFNGANSIGGQARNRFARLDANTGLADSFDPNATAGVDNLFAVTLQPDGKVLAGCDFTSIGGQPRSYFARLSNDTVALQDLDVTQTAITWTRAGSSSQFTNVTFEYSNDNVSYTLLGNGSAVASNWTLTGLNLPTDQNFYIRARGKYRSGWQNGSESITESVRNVFLPTPGLVGNVATRLPVGTGDNTLIQGVIVQGPIGSTKKIMVRALGPSLSGFGVADALANPTLEIHDSSGATVATNNDWKNTQQGGLITGDQSAEISNSGLAPGNDLESAIIANLAPGSYTAVVRGFGDNSGTGVVDAYDMSAASPAKLANIATRGLIQGGDKLMIAGFIVQNAPVTAVIRAIGPSLSAFGITNALADTTLQLRDVNGVIVRENDNWKTDQKAELENTGLQPTDDLEAALVETIQPGQYTAQVRGKNDSSGIGVVQVYFLQ
jgi:uncharacterized delta-60 repeat protein